MPGITRMAAAAPVAIEKTVKASKSKAWGENLDLTLLIKEVCGHSFSLIGLCSELKIAAETTRRSLLLLQDVLKLARESVPGTASIDCEKVSKLLHGFCTLGSPFDGESLQDSFQRVHADCHKQLLQKLQTKMVENEKNAKSAKMWSKISFVMFGDLAEILGICVMVAAMIAEPPPVVGALAAFATFPITSSIGDWMKSLWQSRIHKIQDEYSIFEKMQKHTETHIRVFELLCALVPSQEEHFMAMASTIEFIDRLGGDTLALQLVVDDIENSYTRKEFVKNLDTLEECITKCETHIDMAIHAILDMINVH